MWCGGGSLFHDTAVCVDVCLVSFGLPLILASEKLGTCSLAVFPDLDTACKIVVVDCFRSVGNSAIEASRTTLLLVFSGQPLSGLWLQTQSLVLAGPKVSWLCLCPRTGLRQWTDAVAGDFHGLPNTQAMTGVHGYSAEMGTRFSGCRVVSSKPGNGGVWVKSVFVELVLDVVRSREHSKSQRERFRC